MRELPNLMETDLDSFGAAAVEDFTWKQLLDLDACTMCGRCTSVCPAHATGKPLDPREIVLKVGPGDGRQRHAGHPPPPIGQDAEITRDERPTCSNAVSSEEVWACTSCRACDEICPREHRDPRQDPGHEALPVAHGRATSRPSWARPTARWRTPGTRGAWPSPPARRLGRRLRGASWCSTAATPIEAEYLYWVGCAGSYDDKNRKGHPAP